MQASAAKFVRGAAAVLTLPLLALANLAFAYGVPPTTHTSPSNNIALTFEGCKYDGVAPESFPVDFTGEDGVSVPGDYFACYDPDELGGNDNDYTTGNLGKNYNELDLVPYRLIVENSGEEGEEFNLLIAADWLDGDAEGYDILTDPVIFRYSDAGCVVSAGQQYTDAVTGGANPSVLRQLTIYAPADATCVIEWAGRLAVGSSENAGSSLHAYVFETLSQQGNRTVPIPDAQNPIVFDKEMTATRDSEYNWMVGKSVSDASVNFGNTCELDPTVDTKDVTVTVQWDRTGPTLVGDVNVMTYLKIVNNANRDLNFDLSDALNNGAQLIATQDCPDNTVTVPAGVSDGVTCAISWPSVSYEPEMALNDAATAVLDDSANTCVPCTPVAFEATASASIENSGVTTNETAVITDTEWLIGDNFEFSIESLESGSITAPLGYVLGMVIGANTDVVWDSGTVSDSGSADIAKKIHFLSPKVSSATLYDLALLNASDGLFRQSGTPAGTPEQIAIVTDPKVDLTITKEIPYPLYEGDDALEFCFDVTGTGDDSFTGEDAPCVTFTPSASGSPMSQSVTLNNIVPATYTVVEQAVSGWTPTYQPAGGQVTIDASSFAACADTVTVSNDIPLYPSAKAKKITIPAGSEGGWEFTLKQDGAIVDTCTTDSNGDCSFSHEIVPDILYTIVETTQPGWDDDGGKGDCSFTANWPEDFLDATEYVCTWTNTRRGKIIIEKETVPAGADVDFGFTDDIEVPNGFTLNDAFTDTKTFDNVVPGSYVVNESDPSTGCGPEDDPTNPCDAEWDLVGVQCTDDYDGNGYNVDSSSSSVANLQASIELDPGETVHCKFTNKERGKVVVNKTVNLIPAAGYVFDVTNPAGTLPVATDTTDGAGVADFGGLWFLSGDYALCEQEVDAGWKSSLEDDPNAFYPKVGDNSYVCVPFTVDAGDTVGLAPGETETFDVENTPPPGGNARTIGYWRNWSGECTNGNQEDKLGEALSFGATAGLLVWPEPNTTCEAVNIISKRNLDGENRAMDPAYAMASQYLAYQANVNAGADACGLGDYAAQAEAMLDSVGFNGYDPGNGPKKKDHLYIQAKDKALWMKLAYLFDEYNNNRLPCPFNLTEYLATLNR